MYAFVYSTFHHSMHSLKGQFSRKEKFPYLITLLDILQQELTVNLTYSSVLNINLPIIIFIFLLIKQD